VRQTLGVSERRACRTLGQHRSTQRKAPRGRPDDDALTADIIALAAQYWRYGYRRITALLREGGWAVNVNPPLAAVVMAQFYGGRTYWSAPTEVVHQLG